MSTMLGVLRGIATLALTGLGLLVVLQGDGAGSLVTGAALIGAGLAAAVAAPFTTIVEGHHVEPTKAGV